MTTVRITGTTYPLRDLLKTAGATWDGSAKTWTLDADRWQRIFVDQYNGGGNKRNRELSAAVAGCIATPVEA